MMAITAEKEAISKLHSQIVVVAAGDREGALKWKDRCISTVTVIQGKREIILKYRKFCTTVRYYTCTRSLCRETSGVLLAHVCPTLMKHFSSIMSQTTEMSKAGYTGRSRLR